MPNSKIDPLIVDRITPRYQIMDALPIRAAPSFASETSSARLEKQVPNKGESERDGGLLETLTRARQPLIWVA